MTPHSPPPEIVARINESADTPLASGAQFYLTQNGYWIAWQPETAADLVRQGRFLNKMRQEVSAAQN